MSLINVKVESSNPTKNNDAYCNKLVSSKEITVDTPLGKVTQERKKTFYMFTDQQNEKGIEADLNLALFDVVERVYEVEDEDTNEMVTIKLKYLYPKGA